MEMKLHNGRFVVDDMRRYAPTPVAPPTLDTRIKLLVLVGSSRGFPFDKFLDNWRQAKLPPNVKVYYYFHTEGISEIQLLGDEIHIPGVEHPLQSHPKTMSAYKWALENEEFDVILRPGLSSAFHFPKLLEWLNKNPSTNHCFGRKLWNDFLSGCGYAITRDVVERIVRWTPPIVYEDDLVLRDFVVANGVQVIEWPLEHEANQHNCKMVEFRDDRMTTDFHLRFKTSMKLEERAIDVDNHLKTIMFWNSQQTT